MQLTLYDALVEQNVDLEADILRGSFKDINKLQRQLLNVINAKVQRLHFLLNFSDRKRVTITFLNFLNIITFLVALATTYLQGARKKML